MNEKYENNVMQDHDIEETNDTKKQKQSGKKKHGMVKLLAGALVVGAVAGVAFEGSQYVLQQKAKQESVQKKEDDLVTASATSTDASDGDVSSVVDQVMPSIVAIDTTVTETMNVWGQNYSQQSSGSGSGIIIGENNTELLIATNNHVIEGEDATVQVTFSDESKASATIKGADSYSDLAVLAVKKSDLNEDTKKQIKVATLGNSENVQVGDMAIAIGNALGYGQSVTVGYISAKDREVAMEDSSMTLIQTDAAINPGNSGGALLNAAGEVIGINSVKYSSEEVEGMGYAIPISDAVPIINELMNREQLSVLEQGYLGIKGQEVGAEISEAYNMPQGVYVGEVTKNSPAQDGGIVEGNIITAVNDRSISTLEELQDILSYTKAGTEITITVQELENGTYKEKKLNIKLGSKAQSGYNWSQGEEDQTQQQKQ